MFSINWADFTGVHTVIGNGKAVMAIYSLLMLTKNRDGRDDICSIHVYDAGTGLELNPETGLRDVISRD